MNLRIKNGRIIDPANNINLKGSVDIAKGKIISTVKPTKGFIPDQEIDATDLIVCPGFVDIQARFREPGQEYKATISSESGAAVSAGVTSICCPPDTMPVIDTAAVVELIHQRTQSSRLANIYPLGALTHGLEGKRLAEMQALKSAGCVGVSNAYRPIHNTEVLRRAMEYASSLNMTIFFHPEDIYLRNNGVAHEGAISTRLGLPAIPTTAETIALSQTLLLVEQTGVRCHFNQLSCAKSVEMIATAKQAGLPVTADVAICHLHLTEMDLEGFNANCNLQPPLRSENDRQALRQGLKDGTIDVVCSDHQPHDADAKAAPFGETEPGASTIEVLFPLVHELVKQKILSLKQAIACLTNKPSNILGIDTGTLSVGSSADICIIDPKQNWTVSAEKLRSAGKNTPFDGWKVKGQVMQTITKGRLVFNINKT